MGSVDRPGLRPVSDDAGRQEATRRPARRSDGDTAIIDLQAQNRFHIHQKPTLIINRYRIFVDDGEGKPGELVAFVEQKRATLKEHVTIYAGEDKQAELAEFKARKVIDVSPTFDVTTLDGEQIGVFSKNFGKSLYRSTWTLEQPGEQPVTVSERSKWVAIIRRAWTFIPVLDEVPFPMRYHFDFTRDETVVGSVDKTTRFRDHYLLRIEDDKLDRRLLLAMAVALDAMQSR